MAKLPENDVTTEDLVEWYTIKTKLSNLKTQEHFKRLRIFEFFFKNPKEGANNHLLDDGYCLKGKYVLNRTVDESALDKLREAMREQGINPDELFEYKPTLSKSKFNKLTDEQQSFVNQVLIVKPGSPQLEIVEPKRKVK